MGMLIGNQFNTSESLLQKKRGKLNDGIRKSDVRPSSIKAPSSAHTISARGHSHLPWSHSAKHNRECCNYSSANFLLLLCGVFSFFSLRLARGCLDWARSLLHPNPLSREANQRHAWERQAHREAEYLGRGLPRRSIKPSAGPTRGITWLATSK